MFTSLVHAHLVSEYKASKHQTFHRTGTALIPDHGYLQNTIPTTD